MKVDSSITNLNAFAKHLETDIVTLKTFNAWLIGEKLTNSDKHIFSFRIPKNKNIDLSMYFKYVFPAQKTNDSLISVLKIDTTKVTAKDTLIHK